MDDHHEHPPGLQQPLQPSGPVGGMTNTSLIRKDSETQDVDEFVDAES